MLQNLKTKLTRKNLKIAILILFIFRVFILFEVCERGSWYLGDSAHYLHFASRVCKGDWGGEPGKAPLYLWYLCSLSPNLDYPTLENNPPPKAKVSKYVFLPLLMQLIATTGVGLLILRVSPLGAFFWIFDPVILVYSWIVMPEALLATLLMLFLLQLHKVATTKRMHTKQAATLGALAAMCTLTRPNGLLVSVFGLLLCFTLFLRSKSGLKVTFLAITVFLTLLLPRFYWNDTRYHFLGLNSQGNGWFKSVAGVVENYGKGFDFPTSERLWWREHAKDPSLQMAAQTILHNIGTFTSLTIKGTLRVLFGHVNIELGTLYLGEAPLGPAMTRPQETRKGIHIAGEYLVLWWIGMLWCGAWASTGYALVIKGIGRRFDSFSAYCMVMIPMQALVPLVYGEARFRTGIWPFLIVMMIHLWRQEPVSSDAAQPRQSALIAPE